MPILNKQKSGLTRNPTEARASTTAVNNNVKLDKARLDLDLNNDLNELEDWEFSNKYGTSKHQMRRITDPAYKKEWEERGKETAKEYGSIEYPSTDLRNPNNANPNTAWMYPQLSGEVKQGAEEFTNELIGTELLGLGAEKAIASAYRGAKNIPNMIDKIRYGDELINVNKLPVTNHNYVEYMKNVAEGKPTPLMVKINSGRDIVNAANPKRAYRAVDSPEALYDALSTNNVRAANTDIANELIESGEKVVGKNNYGTDWYLGNYSPKYGKYIIETPATKKAFVRSADTQALHPSSIHSYTDPRGFELPKGTKFYEHTDDGLKRLSKSDINNLYNNSIREKALRNQVDAHNSTLIYKHGGILKNKKK